MSKLTMVCGIALLFVGLLVWNSNAAPIPNPPEHFSLIEKTACGGPGGGCIAGWHKQAHKCVPCHGMVVRCPCPDNCKSCTIRGTPYNCSAQRPGGHWCP